MKVFQSLVERRQHWQGVVSTWRKSGLSQAEFCRQKGLSPKSLSYWARRGRGGRPVNRSSSGPRDGMPVGQQDHSAVRFVPIPSALVVADQKPEGTVVPPPKAPSSGQFLLRIGRRFRLTIPADFRPEGLAAVVRILEGLS